MEMRPPAGGDDWYALTTAEVPVGAAAEWAIVPRCGALVLFVGTVRDHSEGRSGVTALEYETFDEEVVPRLEAIGATARQRWPELGRLALIHRTGELVVGDAAVVVAASAPRRPAAFAAARYCIDTLKSTVPIWKRETWDGGQEWAVDVHPIAEIDELGEPAMKAGMANP